jgi:hypothetical protein
MTESNCKWEDLLQDEVTYLINTLPTLQNPRSPQLKKIISALKYHPVLVSNPEVQVSTSSDPTPPLGTKRKRTRGDNILATAKQSQTKNSSIIQRERDVPTRETAESAEKEKKHGKKKPTHWTTNRPERPEITSDVEDIVTELAAISLREKELELDRFVKTLINPDKTRKVPEGPTSLEDGFRTCEYYENNIAVDDLYHMIMLIQIAIQIERYSIMFSSMLEGKL